MTEIKVTACQRCAQRPPYPGDRLCRRCRAGDTRTKAKPPKLGVAGKLSDANRSWFGRNGYIGEVEQEFRRLTARAAKYGMDLDDWASLVVGQSGACGICRTPQPPLTLHIDHDHHTGRVRGLLCVSCNTGLGLLKIDGDDWEETLRFVFHYFTRSSSVPERFRTVEYGKPSPELRRLVGARRAAYRRAR